MDDYTRKFNAAEDRDEQVHHVLTSVYEALKEKGYDPVNGSHASSGKPVSRLRWKATTIPPVRIGSS